MPSQHMLPKGKRRQTVKPLYRATRGQETAPETTELPLPADDPGDEGVPAGRAEPAAARAVAPSPPREVPLLRIDPYGADAAHAQHAIVVPTEADGMRLDQYLARAIPEISRSRVQLLIESGQVQLNGVRPRGKDRLVAGDAIALEGSPTPPPLAATAEDIPLEVMYEDEWLAIINKPAGMSVHAGAAAPRSADAEDEPGDEGGGHDPRTSGTLVNALLHHFAGKLSGVGGELRPGIVHRLDKQTSGLLVVAKDDRTHQRLAEAFAERTVEKVYLALVHGDLRARAGTQARTHPDEITVDLPIGRDLVRRTRMTTRRPADASGVRSAVSHIRVLERLHTTYGEFSLVEVRIETGRTHQIRVHLQALGHPVVGDTVYGAPAQLLPLPDEAARAKGPAVWRSRSARPAPARLPGEPLVPGRNVLHAARLRLVHPRTGEPLALRAPLPAELRALLRALGSRWSEEGEVPGAAEVAAAPDDLIAAKSPVATKRAARGTRVARTSGLAEKS